jgi:hypothetical protein
MKTTILGIAAAAALTLGTAGAASAAAPAPKAGLFEGVGVVKVQPVYFGHRHWRHRRMCRRLYYRGFVLGHWRARRAFYRLCTHHYWR